MGGGGLTPLQRCSKCIPQPQPTGQSWLGFYGISTIVGYLIPKSLYRYISNIWDLVWLGWVLWHINHCGLFNAKSSLYIYVKYISFDFVEFNGILTIEGYLMPNPLYTYILNIYELVLIGVMTYQPL